MAERIIIQCPGCSTKLGLSDSSKIGKKIRCPKCSEVFVAQAVKSAGAKVAAKPASKAAPAKKTVKKKSDDDEFNFDDTEMEDPSDDEQEDAAPVRSKSDGKKVAAKGKGKGKKKSGGSKMPLIIGGSVAAVLLLGVLGYLLFGGKKTEEPPAAQPIAAKPAEAPAQPANFPNDRLLALKWLPAETELIVHLKVGELWQAPLLKPLLDNPQAQAFVQQMQQFSGLAPTDVESVTFGIKDLQAAQQAGTMAALGAGPKSMPGLCVVRSAKPVDPQPLMSQIVSAGAGQFKTMDHNGKAYVEGPPDEQGQIVGAWLADSNTLLAGTTTELHAAMDRGETTTPKNEFRVIDASSQFVIAVAPKEAASMASAMPPSGPTDPPAVTEMAQVLRSGMTGVGVGLSIKGGVDVLTSLVLRDSASAAKIKPGIDAVLVEAKRDFATKQSTTPPLLFELGNTLLNNVSVSEQNQVAMISTKVPDSDQQKLEQLPGVVMGMFLTGGFGPPQRAAPTGSPIPAGVAPPTATPANSPTPPTTNPQPNSPPNSPQP